MNKEIIDYFVEWCKAEEDIKDETNDPNIKLDWFGWEVGDC